MTYDPPLRIKLKDKQPRKFSLSLPKPFRNLIPILILARQRTPSHNQLLRTAVLDNALREDFQPHVADEWETAPCDGGCVEGGGVGDAAGDGGEMRVGGGEEVEGYLRGEDFLGEGRLEERWELGLEDSEGWLVLTECFLVGERGVG